jgi:hypothetical protein
MGAGPHYMALARTAQRLSLTTAVLLFRTCLLWQLCNDRNPLLINGCCTTAWFYVVAWQEFCVPYYASIGKYSDLLPYFVRRLVKGANVSFANQLF